MEKFERGEVQSIVPVTGSGYCCNTALPSIWLRTFEINQPSTTAEDKRRVY